MAEHEAPQSSSWFHALIAFGAFLAALLLLGACASSPEVAGTAQTAATTAPPTEPAPTATPTSEPTSATAAPAQAPTATPTAEPATPTPEPRPTFDISGDFQITWDPCAIGDCGELIVPVDYDDPDGPTLGLPVARVPARQPSLRVGSLFVNFGGPGGEGIPGLTGFAMNLPLAIQDRFDIVTWNPRGTDGDALLNCPARGELADLLYDAEDGFDDELEAEADRRRDWEQCTQLDGLLDNVGSVTTTKDLEALRQAVGDDALTYLGYSYGTQLGWMYATMFPDQVRALVLDAPVAPGRHSAEGWVIQMENFEEQFARVDRLCNEAEDCAVVNEGLAETVARLGAELAAEPMIDDVGRPLTKADLLQAVTTSLYLSPADSGSLLAEALADLEENDTDLLRIFLDDGFDYAAYDAVTCADGAGINSLPDLEAYITQRFDRGEVFESVPDTVLCDTWPARTQPLPAINTTGTPPILVIATTEDPATPYEGALKLFEQLDDAALITHVGGGHAVVTSDPCVDQYVADYLVNLVTPEADATCFASRAVIGLGFSGDPDDHPGVEITVVSQDSAAEAAGVVPGDILLRIDDVQIESFDDLPVLQGGIEAQVTIVRDGEEIELTMIPIAPDWT